jgi:hypothetical protein
MNAKAFTLPAVLFLVMSHFLLFMGRDSISSQPVDVAHWFLLVSACLLLSFNFVFPKGIFNTIAIVLITLGVLAHIGMCTIDFLLWSYGDNFEARDMLLSHIRNSPAINLPFMTVGPALLYAGLATHAWPFLLRNPVAAVLTLGGAALVGLGQTLWHNYILVIIGSAVMGVGLLMLVFRKQNDQSDTGFQIN